MISAPAPARYFLLRLLLLLLLLMPLSCDVVPAAAGGMAWLILEVQGPVLYAYDWVYGQWCCRGGGGSDVACPPV